MTAAEREHGLRTAAGTVKDAARLLRAARLEPAVPPLVAEALLSIIVQLMTLSERITAVERRGEDG